MLFGQLLNVSQTNYIYCGTFHSEFSYIEVWFPDQISIPLELERRINLALVTNNKSIQKDIQLNPEIEFLLKATDLYSSQKYGQMFEH